jgi:hypothetical protein
VPESASGAGLPREHERGGRVFGPLITAHEPPHDRVEAFHVGYRVVLYPTKTDFGGKRVPCIRIEEPPTGSAPLERSALKRSPSSTSSKTSRRMEVRDELYRYLREATCFSARASAVRSAFDFPEPDSFAFASSDPRN